MGIRTPSSASQTDCIPSSISLPFTSEDTSPVLHLGTAPLTLLWIMKDLNLRSSDYESDAFTNLANDPVLCQTYSTHNSGITLSEWQESNLQITKAPNPVTAPHGSHPVKIKKSPETFASRLPCNNLNFSFLSIHNRYRQSRSEIAYFLFGLMYK